MDSNEPVSTTDPAAAVPPVQDDTQTTEPLVDDPADVDLSVPFSPIVDPNSPDMGLEGDNPRPMQETTGDIVHDVATKIAESHNILIALSSDPSVDEMCSAIGLSLYLDRFGKRATAIYSGATPNALEFLKPEETFESTADALQDFVIALNKEKADHLRYKLDGDYVKIFITPYRTRIAEEDLEFSYGDFNVDLVLALDVANGIDLDAALREHGRIMHDAVVVNITTGKPGKFGEIEWSDKTASSVSEMVAKLVYIMSGKVKMEKEEATAFLTGIVAATNRFSNAATTPETMRMSSRLMESGANQQLISKNVTPDIDNEMFNLSMIAEKKEVDTDPTKLDIEHGNEEGVDETKVVEATVTEKESTLLDDLKAAEESLTRAGAETTPESNDGPVRIPGDATESELEATTADLASAEPADLEPTLPEPTLPEPVSVPEPTSSVASEAPVQEPETITEPEASSVNQLETPSALPDSYSTTEKNTDSSSFLEEAHPEKVIAPPVDFAPETLGEGTNKYGQMLEDALSEIQTPSAPANDMAFTNPALNNAPSVSSAPEINGVPEINYGPMPDSNILPPPPTPPLEISTPIEPASPSEPAIPAPLGSQPAMQDQVYAPQVSDPGAFKIPGM